MIETSVILNSKQDSVVEWCVEVFFSPRVTHGICSFWISIGYMFPIQTLYISFEL